MKNQHGDGDGDGAGHKQMTHKGNGGHFCVHLTVVGGEFKSWFICKHFLAPATSHSSSRLIHFDFITIAPCNGQFKGHYIKGGREEGKEGVASTAADAMLINDIAHGTYGGS